MYQLRAKLNLNCVVHFLTKTIKGSLRSACFSSNCGVGSVKIVFCYLQLLINLHPGALFDILKSYKLMCFKLYQQKILSRDQ